MKYLRKILLFAVAVLFSGLLPVLQAEAGTIYDSPYVKFAPDGEAWTTCPGDTHNYYYADGYTIDTRIEL